LRLPLALCAALALAACGREQKPITVEQPAPVAAPAPVPMQPVTEAQVRAVADAVNAAVGKFDTHDMQLSLADDVRLVAVPPPGFGPTMKVQGRDRVIAQIDSGYANAGNPSYSSRAGAVKMAADGTSGTVEFAAVTRYTSDRHAIVEETTDSYTVAMRNGEPKVVEILQTATGLTIDGTKRF
jgi:hypothetical protein